MSWHNLVGTRWKNIKAAHPYIFGYQYGEQMSNTNPTMVTPTDSNSKLYINVEEVECSELVVPD